MIATYTLNDERLLELDMKEFDCDDQGLNDYFKEHSLSIFQHEQKYNSTLVIVDEEDKKVVAYISSRFNILQLDDSDFARLTDQEIPEVIPAVEVQYLAVTSNQQDRGHGTEIMISIIQNALEISGSIGCRYIFLWAVRKNYVIDFYKKFGFKQMPESSKDRNLMLMRLDLIAVAKYLEEDE